MTTATAPDRVLIRGARVYDHDGDIHQPAVADVLIEGETIAQVGTGLSAEGAEVIEGRNRLVMPGFVNAHYHSHDVMAKGLFEEMPLDFWSLHSSATYFGNRPQEEIRLRTLIGAAEALRNGITTMQDMLTLVPQDEATLDTVISAYREVGIRVALSVASRDRASLDIAPFVPDSVPADLRALIAGQDFPAKTALDFVEGQIKRLGEKPDPTIAWVLGPSGPQRCSHELLEGMAALSQRYDLPVLTHVYETKGQAAAARRLFPDAGGSLLTVLAKAGLMTDRLTVAHGVWLSPDEIAQLGEAGARVVHNPMSNLKLKSGAAPILDLHRAGVGVALGCDNCSCGDTQNIFHAMRMLCLLPAITDPDPTPLDAGYALRAATLTGARATGLHGQVGAIKPGMKADLVVLNLSEPAFVPLNSAARQIVFAEAGRAVETVFVNGRVVVRDGKLTTIDEAALAEQAAEFAPAYRRKVGELFDRYAPLREPLRTANRAAFAIDLGFDRYIGGKTVR